MTNDSSNSNNDSNNSNDRVRLSSELKKNPYFFQQSYSYRILAGGFAYLGKKTQILWP